MCLYDYFKLSWKIVVSSPAFLDIIRIEVMSWGRCEYRAFLQALEIGWEMKCFIRYSLSLTNILEQDKLFVLTVHEWFV